MKYRHDLHNKDWFLRDPRTRKWVVQCVQCQEYGRNPDTPEVAKLNFEENFPKMRRDEMGLCEVCRSLNRRK
jgi:hypothetical protein